MHGEPASSTSGTSSPSRGHLTLALACALFTQDATAAAARILGLPPVPPASPPAPRAPAPSASVSGETAPAIFFAALRNGRPPGPA